MDVSVTLYIFLPLFGNAVLSPVHREEECSVSVRDHSVTLTIFTGDISNPGKRDGFSVMRHSPRGTNTERVLECFWFHKKHPRCLHRPGYNYNKTVTDRVTITITKYLPEKHAGTYVFQFFPLEPEGNIECLLPQKTEPHETSTRIPTTSERPEGDVKKQGTLSLSSATEKPEMDARKHDGRSDWGDAEKALLIVTVVLVSITFLLVGIHWLVTVKNCLRARKTAHDRSDEL